MADTLPCDDVEGSSPVVVKEDEISNSSIVSSNRSVEMLDDEKIELEPGASDSSAQQSGEQSEAVAAGKKYPDCMEGCWPLSPEMEDLNDHNEGTEVDPAAEFLAREQNELAGLEDELKPATVAPTNGSEPEMSDNTGSFEMINTIGDPEVVDQNNIGGGTNGSSPVPTRQPRDEPEKIKKWREEQKRMLEEKDRNEEIKKQELREAAKKELEEWYKHHKQLIAKTRSSNRNAEKQFVADSGAIEPGTEWERIAKLCDFNPKTSRTCKDVSRMRSIVLQLKQTPLNSSKQA